MTNRIDRILEDIDTGVVKALHEIVLSQQEGELLPIFDQFAQEWGLFTLPHFRSLRSR